MGESTKAFLAVIVIAGMVAAGLAWSDNRPDSTTRTLRLGAPAVSLLAVALILTLHFRKDVARDYLRETTGTYFNRGGFCFGFIAAAIDEVAYMDAYFQNQRDRPCVGKIALRPARGFFMTRAEFDAITYEVECPPAGFGVARIAVPIPKDRQGKRQSFEVGASVAYPNGKGRRLRFQDGVFLRTNSKFGSSFTTALMLAGAASGSIVLSRPATVTLVLPTGVAETIGQQMQPEIKTLWQLGDPELS